MNSERLLEGGETNDNNIKEEDVIEKKNEEGNFPMVQKINEYVAKHDYMFRICLIGDANVGKTSLLTRYCDNVFKETYTNTIGVDFRVITMKFDDTLSKVHIWDTAGQERFKSISVNYFRSTHGFMFVYDVTKKQSFINLNNWMEMAFGSNKGSVVNFLIGNKSDLVDEREVSVEEAKEFAMVRKMTYLETSAKTSDNVDKVFEFFSYKLIDYYSQNKKAYEMFSKGNGDRVKVEDINQYTEINVKKKKGCLC